MEMAPQVSSLGHKEAPAPQLSALHPTPRRKRRRQEETEGDGAVGQRNLWGRDLPPEVLLRVFQAAMGQDGAVPILCSCPQLLSLSLSRCGGVPAPPPPCPNLRRLQLRLCQGGLCPQLQLLELDTGPGGCSGLGPPLLLPVEGLQGACPQLKVLRLLNVTLDPRPCRQPPAGVTCPGGGGGTSDGFPQLLELSLASPGGGSGVGDLLLRRLLHRSPRLRLLDLRGCARVTPRGLLDLPCHELESLYLGLPCGSERVPRLAEGSAALARKWRRSLQELDLAGRHFEPGDLAQAMATFSHDAPLRSLNLAGTKITAEGLSVLLATCPGLCYLNLSSCRWLPRGTKRAHQGREEVTRCLEVLLGATGGYWELLLGVIGSCYWGLKGAPRIEEPGGTGSYWEPLNLHWELLEATGGCTRSHGSYRELKGTEGSRRSQC
ncbi:F-box/LRR-repeat protein 6 [Indicator indicator]|uniref:F-box/LRR-repeat protein 6 n=1 Tax=Indicator indicator TaxID=1002788 RepID=UPI0023DEA1FE|nr:F-box/LRR-repeat protein 6 [Indicator indicator]